MKTIIFLLIFIPLSIYGVCKLWGNCCFIDYTENIQKLTDPMQNKLAEFIERNKRAPDREEQKILLNSIGCLDLEEDHRYPELRYNCIFRGRLFSVILDDDEFVGVNDDHKPESIGYFMRITYGTSKCDANLYANGKPAKPFCFKTACIQIYH